MHILCTVSSPPTLSPFTFPVFFFVVHLSIATLVPYRLSPEVLLQEEWRWEPRAAIKVIGDFCDHMKRKYGVAPLIPKEFLPLPASDSLPAPPSLSLRGASPWLINPMCIAPEIVYLEHAFAW